MGYDNNNIWCQPSQVGGTEEQGLGTCVRELLGQSVRLPAQVMVRGRRNERHLCKLTRHLIAGWDILDFRGPLHLGAVPVG